MQEGEDCENCLYFNEDEVFCEYIVYDIECVECHYIPKKQEKSRVSKDN